MSIRYHHTQRGNLMLAVLPFAAAVCAGVGFLDPPYPGRWVLWALAIMFVAMTWIFSSLTVEVTEDDVRWHFGPGLWRYRMPRTDIAATQVVRNTVLNGFGIRRRPGYRLYNVSGFDAVELRLKSGAVRRIGTDDAPGLAAALAS
ncbi:MAG TPA: hypothetical protein VLX44_09455 [Xanthobacteraceae bacterium]|nr:hypothetical protein [Xanthobacteraceae bacterium]